MNTGIISKTAHSLSELVTTAPSAAQLLLPDLHKLTALPVAITDLSPVTRKDRLEALTEILQKFDRELRAWNARDDRGNFLIPPGPADKPGSHAHIASLFLKALGDTHSDGTVVKVTAGRNKLEIVIEERDGTLLARIQQIREKGKDQLSAEVSKHLSRLADSEKVYVPSNATALERLQAVYAKHENQFFDWTKKVGGRDIVPIGKVGELNSAADIKDKLAKAFGMTDAEGLKLRTVWNRQGHFLVFEDEKKTTVASVYFAAAGKDAGRAQFAYADVNRLKKEK